MLVRDFNKAFARPITRIPSLMRTKHEINIHPVMRLCIQTLPGKRIPNIEDVAVNVFVWEGGEIGSEQVGGRVEDGVAEEAQDRGVEG